MSTSINLKLYFRISSGPSEDNPLNWKPWELNYSNRSTSVMILLSDLEFTNIMIDCILFNYDLNLRY